MDAKVDADASVAVVLAYICGRLDDVDACVVHEDVDPPKRLDRRLDEPATTVAVTRVDVSRKCGATSCINGGGGFFDLAGVPGADDHCGIGLGKSRGHRFAVR